MNITDVVELHGALENAGVELWLDGGWAVDALLGEQTRPHDDVDIVVEQKDVPGLRDLVERRGYTDVPRDDTRPWNFVLGDHQGRRVDVHVIVLDSEGNGIYGPAERGEMFPAAALTGRGVLAGRLVRCTSAEYLVQSRTGYALREKDWMDIAALCARFGIEPR